MGEGLTAHGLTVSAFTAVSLEPPTVLVCINKRSRAHGLLHDRPYFAVNILSAAQENVSNYFARTGGGARFEKVTADPLTSAEEMTRGRPRDTIRTLKVARVDLEEEDDDVIHRPARTIPVPVLEGSAVILECVVTEVVASGDHITYFGQVEAIDVSNLDPLLYFDGDYQDVIFGRRRMPR